MPPKALYARGDLIVCDAVTDEPIISKCSDKTVDRSYPIGWGKRSYYTINEWPTEILDTNTNKYKQMQDRVCC